MHCTGQTSTHARSLVSTQASVMIASPAISSPPDPCRCGGHRTLKLRARPRTARVSASSRRQRALSLRQVEVARDEPLCNSKVAVVWRLVVHVRTISYESSGLALRGTIAVPDG